MTSTSRNIVKAAAEAKLRAQGFVPVAHVASKLAMNPGSVYRWIAEKEVVSMKLGNKRFIKLDSVVKKVGAEAAAALGLIATTGGDSEIEVET